MDDGYPWHPACTVIYDLAILLDTYDKMIGDMCRMNIVQMALWTGGIYSRSQNLLND